jgi:glycosyltransferase involved in cell wall biosynthesis
MSGRAAYIVSLKYSPGLRRLFEVIGSGLQKRGLPVAYLGSAKYAGLGPLPAGFHSLTEADSLGGILRETAAMLAAPGRALHRLFTQEPGFVCFYNPHPLNLLLARDVRRRYPDAVVAVYVHEPFMPDKAAFGSRRARLIKMIEATQAWAVRSAHVLLAPSDYAVRKIRVRYPWYRGDVRVTPLLIPDKRAAGGPRPRYFSMVGNANDATGHDDLFRFVSEAAAKGRAGEFAVASASDLCRYAAALTEGGRERVRFLNKPLLLDHEIDAVLRESLAVLRLDRGLTQSAVLVDAFMHGVPVIARDIPGLRQHVRDGVNGRLVPYAFTYDDLAGAMDDVRTRRDEMSGRARRDFESIWSADNFDRTYGWLVDLLRGLPWPG